MVEKRPETKRVMISKAQRLTLFEVLMASLVLGACAVIAIFLIKYIDFNTLVITAKSDAITEYDTTLRNVGICVDADNNGRLSDAELEKCDPNAVKLENVKGSLRYNIYNVMAQNASLEAVARQNNVDGICFDEEGVERDFTLEYAIATTDEARELALQGARHCSALRVIPDALPASKNTEALMASLNEIFILSDVEPDSITPRDTYVNSEITGIQIIPVSFRVEGTGAEIVRTLNNLEKSIRNFDITTADFEWTTRGIALKSDAEAYYLDDLLEPEVTISVYARNGIVSKGTSNTLKGSK